MGSEYVMVEDYESGSDSSSLTRCSCPSCCSTCGDSDNPGSEKGSGDADCDDLSDCSSCLARERRRLGGGTARRDEHPRPPPELFDGFISMHKCSERREAQRNKENARGGANIDHSQPQRQRQQQQSQDGEGDPWKPVPDDNRPPQPPFTTPRENNFTHDKDNNRRANPGTNLGASNSGPSNNPQARGPKQPSLTERAEAKINHWIRELQNATVVELRIKDQLEFAAERKAEQRARAAAAAAAAAATTATMWNYPQFAGWPSRPAGFEYGGTFNAGGGDDHVRDGTKQSRPQEHFMSGGRSVSSATRRRMP